MTAPGIPNWPAYDRWNAAIADEFFAGRYGGRPVYLDLEDDVMDRIALAAESHDEDPFRALIDVVGPTLHLIPRVAIFSSHRRRLGQWKARGRTGAPPVIAVLALLSVVAEQMTSDADFRASNYYGRFLRTLGYSSQDPQLRQKVIRCFADESHVLWAGLNDWLSEDPAVRGRPTAYAFDYRIHVGVPMSQALVRDADRAALRDLFVDLRLSPRQQLPHADMVRLLRDWLPQSTLSSTLKTLCQSEEALLRVADVACIELEAWEGSSGTSSGGSRHRVAFVASYRRHPRPRLSLGLAVRIGSRGTRELVLDPEAGPAAVQALVHADGRLELSSADEDGWADVLNVADVSLSHALTAVLTLQAAGVRLRRIPRRLVIFEHDLERRRYIEVDRVRLGGDYMLVAAETLGSLLDNALDEAARPGWRRHDGQAVAGLPVGWRLYTGVEILGITSSKQIDLAALVPIAWTHLTLRGGLRLPGRANWLTSAPPEASASSLAGEPVIAVLRCELPTNDAEESGAANLLHDRTPHADPILGEPTPAGSLAVTPETALADLPCHDIAPAADTAMGVESLGPLPDADPDAQILGQVDPAAIFDLGELALPDGCYRITLSPPTGEGTPLSSITFNLASPDPRSDESVSLAYASPAAGIGALSAQPTEEGIRGALVPDHGTPAATPGPRLDAGLVRWDGSEEEEEVDPDDGVREDAGAVVSLPTCMETGAHYFKLPSTIECKGQREIHAVCEHCCVERFFPARPARRLAAARAGRGERLAAAAALPKLSPKPAEAPGTDHDLLLEALSTITGGDWRSFEGLVAQMDDRPWAPIEAMRTLTALGHVDVELDDQRLRPIRWSIAPAVLVAAPNTTFLSGWRCELLLEALGRITVQRGGTVAWEPALDAPTVIRVLNVDGQQLCELADEVAEVIGRNIQVATDPASALVAQLPTLDVLRGALPRMSAPIGLDVERFDASTGRWTRVLQPTHVGGYRTTRLPRRFWHFNGRDWRATDARLVKWLGASSSRSMIAYDPITRTLACHMGGQLPGLYDRVAMLSSGRPAQRTESGHLIYADISPSVAAGLAQRLSTAGKVQVNAA